MFFFKRGILYFAKYWKKNFFFNENIKEAILILLDPGPFNGSYVFDEILYKKQFEERELKEIKNEVMTKSYKK